MRVLKRTVLSVPLLVLAAIVVGLPSIALGDEDRGEFSARLTGFQEVPAVFSDASATLRLSVQRDRVEYELRYANLAAAPTAAHLHFGERHVNGGVFVFLCGRSGVPPACPSTTSGRVQGSFDADDILAPAVNGVSQGLAAGNFAGALRIIRAGAAYANIHNSTWPAGEIRGQVLRE